MHTTVTESTLFFRSFEYIFDFCVCDVYYTAYDGAVKFRLATRICWLIDWGFLYMCDAPSLLGD